MEETRRRENMREWACDHHYLISFGEARLAHIISSRLTSASTSSQPGRHHAASLHLNATQPVTCTAVTAALFTAGNWDYFLWKPIDTENRLFSSSQVPWCTSLWHHRTVACVSEGWGGDNLRVNRTRRETVLACSFNMKTHSRHKEPFIKARTLSCLYPEHTYTETAGEQSPFAS